MSVIWTRRIARWVVGALLLYAGLVKARAPGTLIQDIWNYRLLPEEAAYWIAAGLPYLEIVLGVALITGLQSRGAHALAIGLFVFFTAATATAWMRGLDIACGCFGDTSTDEPSNLPLLIARNLAILAALAWSAFGFFDKRAAARTAPRPPV